MTSIKKTWDIFKTSKDGIAGIVMLTIIVLMAVLAPILTPYSTDFTAPRSDTYLGDEKNLTLPSTSSFNDTPIGISPQTTFTGGENLTKILIYSTNGVVYEYPVSVGSWSRIILNSPIKYTLPNNINNISYFKFVELTYKMDRFLIVANKNIYLLDENFILLEQYNLTFYPKYFSELWNAFSVSAANANNLIFIMADDSHIAIYSITAHVESPGSRPIPVSYFEQYNYTGSKIIAPPLLVYEPSDSSYPNGTMIIIPRADRIEAYNLTADIVNQFGNFEYSKIRIGQKIWVTNLTIDGVQYNLFDKNSFIFPYPNPDQLGFGKDRLLIGTQNGHIISLYRNNGTVGWNIKFTINSAVYRNYQLSALFPSQRSGTDAAEILVSADVGTKSLIAALDVKTGYISHNGTLFMAVDGHVNYQPYYVIGLKLYLISTDAGDTYIITELLNRTASFSIVGGAKTPAVFLGNIVEIRSITGNYFGVVSKTNQLFVESLTGVDVAPLQPGRYASGNYYTLGTDDAGHDIFTWLLYGARSELVVGITAALVSVVLGTLIGLLAGYFSGVVDVIIGGFVDVLLCLPSLVILAILASILGPNIINIIIIVGVLGWPGITRVIRSVVLSLKERAYMDSARVTGASSGRMIFVHLLPNVMPYAFFFMAISVSGAILTEAALAFLGFGDPNAVTWGMMLQYFRTSGVSITNAWWWLFPPGIMITVLSLSFYLIGRGFDAVLDPKLRER